MDDQTIMKKLGALHKEKGAILDTIKFLNKWLSEEKIKLQKNAQKIVDLESQLCPYDEGF